MPGVHINLSSRGVSTTIGPPGFNVNIGGKGTFLNQGIPGIGLYNRSRLDGSAELDRNTGSNQGQGEYDDSVIRELLGLPEYDPNAQIKSGSVHEITSPGLAGIKEVFLAAEAECIRLKEEMIEEVANLTKLEKKRKSLSRFPIWQIFKSWAETATARCQDKVDEIKEIEEQQQLAAVQLDTKMTDDLSAGWNDIKEAFEFVAESFAIWDTTEEFKVDPDTKSAAQRSLSRVPVEFTLKDVEFIKSDTQALHLENANGGNLFIYPGFIMVRESGVGNFALIELKDLEVKYSEVHFVETEHTPEDAALIKYTWAKVNKDGSPDRRFVGNYEIPVLRYGELTLTSSSGLNERYMVSRAEILEGFSKMLTIYFGILKNR